MRILHTENTFITLHKSTSFCDILKIEILSLIHISIRFIFYVMHAFNEHRDLGCRYFICNLSNFAFI